MSHLDEFISKICGPFSFLIYIPYINIIITLVSVVGKACSCSSKLDKIFATIRSSRFRLVQSTRLDFVSIALFDAQLS